MEREAVGQEKGKDLFIQSMNHGNECARAMCTYQGWGGIEKNAHKGVRMFSEADGNHARFLHALYQLSFSSPPGSFCVSELKRIAESGHVGAQCCLGYCHSIGKCVPKNDSKAVKWYQKAVTRFNLDAMNNLAICYMKGTGVMKDQKLAISLLNRASKRGSEDATYNLIEAYVFGLGVTKNYTKAMNLMNKLECKDARIYNLSGFCMSNSDPSLAICLYVLSARSFKDADGLYLLGDCYENGKGIGKNMTHAVDCFHQSAKKGCDLAHYRLGHCLEQCGDLENAIKSYKRAEKASVKARRRLGRIHDINMPVACRTRSSIHKSRTLPKKCDEKEESVLYPRMRVTNVICRH